MVPTLPLQPGLSGKPIRGLAGAGKVRVGGDPPATHEHAPQGARKPLPECIGDGALVDPGRRE